MAFEIVDGMTGTKHISSDDLSALNIATIGESNCVLNYGDNFKLTMTNANTATLGTGVGMVGGKRFWNHAATSLTVQSGTQGQKRNDLVVARYAKTSAGIESITPVVIKGTPTTGTAADPEVTANDLKLWRVPLNGISVGEPVKLFEPVASLATLRNLVTPTSGHFLYTNSGKNGDIYYSKMNNILFITIINCRVNAGNTTLCILPQGCRPPVQRVVAIADTVNSAHNSRFCTINANGEVTVKASTNGEYIWTSAAIILGV